MTAWKFFDRKYANRSKKEEKQNGVERFVSSGMRNEPERGLLFYVALFQVESEFGTGRGFRDYLFSDILLQ